MCVLQTTHLTDKLVWFLVCQCVMLFVEICGHTNSIAHSKVGVANKRSWPTARLDNTSHRDYHYCATWFKAMYMTLEVKINSDPS